MPKGTSPENGAETIEKEEGEDVIVAPTTEETVDARIEQAITPLKRDKTDPLEEADKASEEEEVEEEPEKVVSKEVIPEEKKDESIPPVVEQILPTREASSIDKRIAQLYQETQILQGQQATPIEEILEQVKTGSLPEKQAALHRLLTNRKILKNGGVDDGKPVEASEEDQEALIQAEVDERLALMQEEVEQNEIIQDFVQVMKDHPELDESSKEFNPKIANAVARLAKIDPETGIPQGMKVSEAYSLVMDSIEQAKVEKEEAAELEKQKALSGVVSTGGSFEEGSTMTDEEIRKLRTTSPKEYNRLVKEGKI